jgi:hypothetical protein
MHNRHIWELILFVKDLVDIVLRVIELLGLRS